MTPDSEDRIPMTVPGMDRALPLHFEHRKWGGWDVGADHRVRPMGFSENPDIEGRGRCAQRPGFWDY